MIGNLVIFNVENFRKGVRFQLKAGYKTKNNSTGFQKSKHLLAQF